MAPATEEEEARRTPPRITIAVTESGSSETGSAMRIVTVIATASASGTGTVVSTTTVTHRATTTTITQVDSSELAAAAGRPGVSATAMIEAWRRAPPPHARA